MSDVVRVGLVLAVVAIMFLLIKRQGRFFAGGRRRGRPIRISNPPQIVPVTDLGKSASRAERSNGPLSDAVFFVTENTTIEPLHGKASTTVAGSVLTSGAEDHHPSPSGLFELHVYFSVHNWSDRVMSIHDIRAKLYHVSAGYTPLTIGYVSRFRVDLINDNSILKAGSVIKISHGSAAHIDLAFETGFYDDTGTTLAVFGLEVDLQLSGSTGVTKWRLPSDKVYVLQHTGPPYSNGSEPYVGSMDAAYITKCYEKERKKTYWMPDSAAAQTMDRAVIYECIGQMLAAHLADGFHEIA